MPEGAAIRLLLFLGFKDGLVKLVANYLTTGIARRTSV